jgi:RNA recognition motif-containing protein
MNKLFIGGFPLNIDEMQLAELIAPFGELSTIKLVRDKQTRKCKGYGFVEMKNAADVAVVITNLNGMQMGNRELTINEVPDEVLQPAPFYKKAERPGDPLKKKRPRRIG